jgi:hypothetical protein
MDNLANTSKRTESVAKQGVAAPAHARRTRKDASSMVCVKLMVACTCERVCVLVCVLVCVRGCVNVGVSVMM